MDSGAETHWTNVNVPPFRRSAWMSGPRSRPGSGAESATAMVWTIAVRAIQAPLGLVTNEYRGAP